MRCAKFSLITLTAILATACATSQQGVLKTPNNTPLTITESKRSATLLPGPITAKVNYTFHKVYFENDKKLPVGVPFISGQANDEQIKRFKKEHYSHFGNHQEVFITNIGETYTTETEGTCYTTGNCRKPEGAVICAGNIYGEHSRSREYQQHKSDTNCTHFSSSYSARNESCEGRATTRVLNQDYTAFDSFDFFNIETEGAEAYFDSHTTQRTKELSRETGTCFIKDPT
jgi:hypothetical protein